MPFAWPPSIRAAVSLSFDDARPSAVLRGAPILAEHGLRGTFFVLMNRVREQPDAWLAAHRAGHELGNHLRSHPCSGNFAWSRGNALEDWTLERMAAELDGASADIAAFCGARPTSFAYCCGQTFVGRGAGTRSYVPLVAERFRVGRGYRTEHPNDPAFVDLAQVGGVAADGLDAAALIAAAEQAERDSHWLVLAGHGVGEATQSVGEDALAGLCRWLRTRPHIWTGTVAEVGAHIATARV